MCPNVGHHYFTDTLALSPLTLLFLSPPSAGAATTAAAMQPLLLLLALLATSATLTHAHNITKILAQHPEFSTFNHYLTTTHLASEINRRLTITVLAVDNAGMSSLLSKHLSPGTLKNVLLLHILVDYYGAKKLHQLTGGSTVSSSMFQATGAAPGTTGYVNITDHRAGRVTFAAQDAGAAAPAAFVKTIKEQPYNLSVIQISTTLTSPEAEAPTAAPAPVNLTGLMSAKGCKLFAGLLEANPDVLTTYQANVDGGLTAFCPIDKAVSAFAPKYKNLTAGNKTVLLLYHAVPIYFSLQMLKTDNGVVDTLASDGSSKNYKYTVQDSGETVTIKTKITTASITKTLIDQDQLAVYSIDKVLEPRELFKGKAEEEAEAPAPAAESPKKAKHPKSSAASPPAPSGPEESPADQKAADDNAGVMVGGGWATVAVAVAAALAVLV